MTLENKVDVEKSMLVDHIDEAESRVYLINLRETLSNRKDLTSGDVEFYSLLIDKKLNKISKNKY